MNDTSNSSSSNSNNNINQMEMASSEEDDQMNMMEDLRRGPWTVEEDFTLINYIAHHGEGRWNSLARCAGLKRTGKSCRLRWLNYLRPDVRRGNITLEEQLLILELHSQFGNRWSKIAQYLPGRTDNEIKNYWRTRVQKHAKQLKCDVNSKQFKDTMRYLWMPRLVERIQAAATTTATATGVGSSSTTTVAAATTMEMMPRGNNNSNNIYSNYGNAQITLGYTPENTSTAAMSPVSDLTDCYFPVNRSQNQDYNFQNNVTPIGGGFSESLISPSGYYNQGMDFQYSPVEQNHRWPEGGGGDGDGDLSDNLWNMEDIWFLQQQFNM